MRSLIRRVGQFLSELRRRRVYQVAAAYIVLAFAGLEALDILVPITRLPEGSTVLFLGLAVVGFPLALVIAWVFDVTPTGVERTAASPVSPDSTEGIEAAGRDKSSAAESTERSGAGDLDPLTVAVLPFESLSGGPEVAALVSGLHDDLVVELSRASALRVISGSSVRAFQREGRAVWEIGVLLGAGTVVLGTVQGSGDRVRLNIQMVDARTEQNRWAERYDRELTAENIFDLQTELASRVRSELRARLTSEEAARSPGQPTQSLDAYRLYVTGRRELETWSERSIRSAARAFMDALVIDEGYALAWSGLADALSLIVWYNYAPVPDAPEPMAAATRALELDPTLAEAHGSRAIVLASPRVQDAPGARKHLERALQLRPSYAYAYAWLGWVDLLLGDSSSAVEAETASVQLDPLSPAAHAFLAEALLADGQYGAALKAIDRSLDLQPTRPLAHLFRGLILHHLGRFEEALGAFEDMTAGLSPDGTSPTAVEALAFQAPTLGALGRTDRVTEILHEPGVARDPFCRGLVHASLGDTEQALTAFRDVDVWAQLSTEAIRFFYPGVLGSVRAAPSWPALEAAADRSWRMR